MLEQAHIEPGEIEVDEGAAEGARKGEIGSAVGTV
jgi:hypothetical protein